MKNIPDNSFHAVVTDPPYGLSFMGRDWDHGVPGKIFWEEILRVAKPGAFLLAFGGTRTHHRLMVAIEDAGWEIRDCLMWLYGSGFPKSYDISKGIDKVAGAEREKIGLSQWASVRGGKRQSEYNFKEGSEAFVTAPVTDAAKQWDGWGTALKPAWEPIILARKKFKGTVAENILENGVGGLNIDACRIEFSSNDDPRIGKDYEHHAKAGLENGLHKENNLGDSILLHKSNGRWPANLILDEEAGEMLDQQSGITKSTGGGGYRPSGSDTKNGIYGKYGERNLPSNVGLGDTGGASRFFYIAKASRKDRGEYNDHATVKPTSLMRHLCRLVTPSNGIVFDPFMGSGSTGKAAILENFRFYGIDKEKIEIATRRIEEAILTLG
jgi:site-specific DNA-methyltransferase (adenine-specific)